MDLATIQHLRSKHGNKSEFVLYTMDNVLYFHDHKDFLVWDDENQVLHAVRANTSGSPEYVASQAPVVVKSVSYDQIFFVSSAYDINVFKEHVIDEFFGSLLAPAQKEILVSFVDRLSCNQDIEYNNDKYNKDIRAEENTVKIDPVTEKR